MKSVNKRKLLYCIIISVAINASFFIRQKLNHQVLKQKGIVKELYVKELNNNEATFFQKAKYTKVAKTYFVTYKGDSIYDIRKNTWGMQVAAFDGLDFYLPLDSVIYDNNNPYNYQLISEFRNYSLVYSIFAYFVFGLIVFTAWLYLMTLILEKGIERFRSN